MYAFAAVRTSAGSSFPCACISSILVFISSSVSTSSSSLKLSAASSRVCWSLVASSNASQMVSSTDASRADRRASCRRPLVLTGVLALPLERGPLIRGDRLAPAR